MPKKKKIIVSVLTLLIIVATCFAIKTITKKKEIQYSCYDYIVDTMAEPELYDETYIRDYGSDIYNEIAREKMPNGSGFKYDEETETFYRGYYSQLVYDFNEYKSYNRTINDYEYFNPTDNRDSSYSVSTTYDFKNRILTNDGSTSEIPTYTSLNVIKDGKNVLNNDGTFKQIPYSYWFDNEFEFTDMKYRYDEYIYISSDITYNIEKSMNRYEKKFSSAGCPLLNQPKGTMEKYKNVEANPLEEGMTKSYKIEAPWNLDNFTLHYADSELNMLADFKDIDIEVQPDSKTGQDQIIVLDHYGENTVRSPVYLALIKGEKDEETSMSENGMYSDIMGAFCKYVLAPEYKNMYGYDAVYFYSLDDAMNGAAYNDNKMTTPTYDEIKNGKFNLDTSLAEGCTFRIEKDGIVVTSINNPLFEDTYIDCYLEMLADYLASYNAEAEWIFGDQYLFNFLCLYSKTYQNYLGLR